MYPFLIKVQFLYESLHTFKHYFAFGGRQLTCKTGEYEENIKNTWIAYRLHADSVVDLLEE